MTKLRGFEARSARVQNLALIFTSFGLLGKFLELLEFQFPHLRKGILIPSWNV